MREEMVRYIVKRLVWLPIFLLIISFIVFCIGMFGPGDPALVRAGPQASTETIERIRQQMGLDRPIIIQYLDYMSGFIRGDLGESLIYPDKSVNTLLLERMVISGPIVLVALVVSLAIGITAGLLCSLKRGTWIDNTIMTVFMFFDSIPSLILVQFLVLLLSLKLHLLPAKWSGGVESILTLQIVIPVLSLALLSLAGTARYVRATTLRELDQNYVRFARAKGLPERVIATKYVLRNALLPLITMIIPSVLSCVSGSFFIEFLYGIPGTGQFMVTAIFQRDYPVITAFTVIMALLFVVGNVIQDILYPLVDPRAQLTKRTF